MERRIHVLNEAGLFMGQLALRMKRDAIRDIIDDDDLVLQDYLVEECRELEIDQDDAKSCLDYAIHILYVLEKANDHIYMGIKLGLSKEERQIADMLWGVAPHKWTEELVRAAKEVTKMIMHRIRNHDNLNDEKRQVELVRSILKEVERICDECNFPLSKRDEKNNPGMELLYIVEWLEYKI